MMKVKKKTTFETQNSCSKSVSEITIVKIQWSRIWTMAESNLETGEELWNAAVQDCFVSPGGHHTSKRKRHDSYLEIIHKGKRLIIECLGSSILEAPTVNQSSTYRLKNTHELGGKKFFDG